MSISSRIEAINDHLIDDYKVLRLAGADLTGVNKNIVNLKMSWKERLLYFMNNGTDEVWNNWTKVNGTGTALSLNNTEEAPMSLVYKGNTYQDSTTGKNLLSNSLANMETNNTTGTWNNNAYTLNGITWTPVYENGLLKYINANGTATEQSDFIVGKAPLINGTTYVGTGCPSGGSTTTYRIFYTYIGADYGTGVMLTSTETVSSLATARVYNGATANNLKFYPMVRLSSITDATYEPYTNGTSPNPDYPQEVQVVSGDNSINISNEDNTQSASYPISLGDKELCKIGTYQDKIDKSTGKNLFDKDNANVNNSYVSNIGVYYTDNSARTVIFNVNPNTTYTLTLTKDGFSSSQYWMTNIGLYSQTPTNNVSGNSYYSFRDNNVVSFTTGNNDYYMAFSICYGTSNIQNLYTYLSVIQIEKGSQATPYEPYGTNWYLKKEIGKVVLNGSEAWVNLNYAYYSTVLNSLIKNIATTDQSIYVMADHFKGESAYQAGTQGTAGIYTVNTQLYLRGYNSTYADINALKTFLSSNNTIVYYVLATPTYEPITDTTLIGQLEALKKSYEGQTNISQVNNDLPFELSVTALEVMS